jgi:hypothetical protein
MAWRMAHGAWRIAYEIKRSQLKALRTNHVHGIIASFTALLKSLPRLEVVSKPQIRFKGKASCGLKTERTRQYVSISIRGTTQPLGLRWGFETTSI